MSDTDIHPRPSLTATSTPLNLHQRGDNTTNILQLEVQNKKAGLIHQDDMRELLRQVVYIHIVRVLLDGARGGTLDCMLKRVGCTDLVKLRRFIRQPHYHQWLDTQRKHLTDEQYRGLHGLESYLNYVQNNTAPMSDGYADIRKGPSREFLREAFLDYCYLQYNPGKPITYDEKRALESKKWPLIRGELIRVRDLYGIEYRGHPSSTMGSNNNVRSIGSNSNNKSNTKVRTDQHVLVGSKPRVSIMDQTTSTDNGDRTSVINGTYISRKVQSGKENHSPGSVNDDTLSSGTFDTRGHTHDTSMVEDSGTDIGVGNIDSSVPDTPVHFDVKNVSHTAYQPTTGDSILKSSTDDPDIAFLNKLLRTTTKRIKRSIARHITGSSRDYTRAVSICE